MKKIKFYFCILFFIYSNSIFCQQKNNADSLLNKNFSFELSPRLSTNFGNFGEYLFLSNKTDLCSYLEWQLKPLFTYGLETTFNINNFSIALTTDFSFFQECGAMNDSDWNIENIKTTFSTGTNKTNFSFNSNLFCSYNFFTINNFSFAVKGGINYSYYSFERLNAQGWYGTKERTGLPEDVWWDNPNAKHYSKLSGIEYYTHNFNIQTGIFAIWNCNPKLNFALTFLVAPFSYNYNTDLHKNANTGENYYTVDIENSFFNRFIFEGTINYSIDDKLSISSINTFTFEPIKKGKTYVSTIDGEDIFMPINQPSGKDFYLFTTTLCLKILF